MELVKDYVKSSFPSTKLLDYALAVEEVTTSKKDNLILNVDGCIAVCFVDLLRNCGAFSPEEAEDYLGMGVLNGLFVLGRSIGLIAHFLDQKRLRTGLYRHPWEVRCTYNWDHNQGLMDIRISPIFYLSLVSLAERVPWRDVLRSRCRFLKIWTVLHKCLLRAYETLPERGLGGHHPTYFN